MGHPEKNSFEKFIYVPEMQFGIVIKLDEFVQPLQSVVGLKEL